MADTQNIAVELSFPSLPEGWRGTPQQFLQWISENAIFSASGSFLTGQIGGARPTTNVGIYVNGQTIELWQGGSTGKYVPLLALPIGVVLDWPCASLTPPDNYLFCDGRLLTITEYPELYAALGGINNPWKLNSDDATKFRLPDYRGRVGVGADESAGDYYKPDGANRYLISGKLSLRTVGSYFGNEWPTYNAVNAWGASSANMATPRYSVTLQVFKSTAKAPDKYYWNKGDFNGVQPPSLGVRKIIKYK